MKANGAGIVQVEYQRCIESVSKMPPPQNLKKKKTKQNVDIFGAAEEISMEALGLREALHSSAQWTRGTPTRRTHATTPVTEAHTRTRTHTSIQKVI